MVVGHSVSVIKHIRVSVARENIDTKLSYDSFYLNHVMRKPVNAICEQQMCRSACASMQSDQCLCCSLLG